MKPTIPTASQERVAIADSSHTNPYEPPSSDSRSASSLDCSAWRLRLVGMIIAVHHLGEISLVLVPPPNGSQPTIVTVLKWTTLPVLLSAAWFAPACLGQRRYGLFFVCMTPLILALCLTLLRSFR